MTSRPAGPQAPWWRALPPAETQIACGQDRHTVRWADGSLIVPAHPDVEAELVLAALGGEEAACTGLAGTWARHTDDLDVLALGPRSAADRFDVTWDDVEMMQSAAPPPATMPPRRVWWTRQRTTGSGWLVTAGGFTSVGAGGSMVRPSLSKEEQGAQTRRVELMSLFVLGPAFQLRLAGTVAAAWASVGQAGAAGSRPALAAALTGRLALAVAEWLGIDPATVSVCRHEGPGWGSLEVGSAAGPGGGVRASLPLDWLARVWASGLAVVDGHLVVAVGAARWPDARVLALPAPGADPVSLSVHAGHDAGEPWAIWEPRGR